jgi:hypothetical protein
MPPQESEQGAARKSLCDNPPATHLMIIETQPDPCSARNVNSPHIPPGRQAGMRRRRRWAVLAALTVVCSTRRGALGSSYRQIAGPLVATGGGPQDRQGTALAFSGDGSTLVVGANGVNRLNGSTGGGVYVYSRDASGAYVQSTTAPLLASGATSQGSSVALTPDASILAVGAPDTRGKGGTVIYLRESNGQYTSQSVRLSVMLQYTNDDCTETSQGT